MIIGKNIKNEIIPIRPYEFNNAMKKTTINIKYIENLFFSKNEKRMNIPKHKKIE
tara:strand:- start:70 stop:234 length:165 start_codon:yes stop_codon:yes gene_type:complete